MQVVKSGCVYNFLNDYKAFKFKKCEFIRYNIIVKDINTGR